MTRDLRIQYPGAIYHVTSRGNRREPIVLGDEDRGEFWTRIGETVDKYGWEMFAAVLLTNHFHLFFRTPKPNLSLGMQYLLGGYALSFNKRHGRVGHVFQGRFRNHVIEDESYYWTVSRYVHLNPVPALVMRPADWPWSTYAGYVDLSRRWNWVAYDTLLDAWQGAFGGENASQRYQAFVEQSLYENADPFADAIDGWILGSQEFAENVRRQLQPKHRRGGARPTDVPTLLALVCTYFGIPKRQLAWRRSSHPARPVFASLAKRHTDATLRELAPLLGLARADCVPHLVQRALRAPAASPIQRAIQQIEQQLQL